MLQYDLNDWAEFLAKDKAELQAMFLHMFMQKFKEVNVDHSGNYDKYLSALAQVMITMGCTDGIELIEKLYKCIGDIKAYDRHEKSI